MPTKTQIELKRHNRLVELRHVLNKENMCRRMCDIAVPKDPSNINSDFDWKPVYLINAEDLNRIEQFLKNKHTIN